MALTEPSITSRGNIRDTDSCAGFPDTDGVWGGQKEMHSDETAFKIPRNCSRLSCANTPFPITGVADHLKNPVPFHLQLHPPHDACTVLTAFPLKRMRGFSLGNPLWSKPPAFLYRSYSTSLQISVAGMSSQCALCSQNLLMAPSYTIIHNSPKSCPPALPSSVVSLLQVKKASSLSHYCQGC